MDDKIRIGDIVGLKEYDNGTRYMVTNKKMRQSFNNMVCEISVIPIKKEDVGTCSWDYFYSVDIFKKISGGYKIKLI